MQIAHITRQARFALPVAGALLLGVGLAPSGVAADQAASPPSTFTWNVQLADGSIAIGGYSPSIAEAITLAEQDLSPQYYAEVVRQITAEGQAAGAPGTAVASAPAAPAAPVAMPSDPGE